MIAIVVDDLGLSFESTVRAREAVKRFIDRLEPGDRRMKEQAGAGEPPLTNPNDFRASVLAVGTLGAMKFVVRGMQDLPGRKAVVPVTDGFSLFTRRDPDSRVMMAVRRLADAANRSFVVLYTLDAKGLVVLSPGADRASDEGSEGVSTQSLWDSQDGPYVLAAATGGMSFRNDNDITRSLTRALDDQHGYYLLGFEPREDTFPRPRERPRFHRLQVKVKRPGLRVRARSGFFGITDDDLREAERGRLPDGEGADLAVW